MLERAAERTPQCWVVYEPLHGHGEAEMVLTVQLAGLARDAVS